MTSNPYKSIRTFIGAKNYAESRQFYKELDFTEIIVGKKMIYFKIDDNLGFYLQDYYAKEWIENSMIFLEVENLDDYYKRLVDKQLPKKYKQVKLTKIIENDWGRECFLHDPSGVLWHFGTFKK
jgi:hypothetical protein